AGGVIGLRAFSQNTASMLLTDIRGQATGLNIQSLHDFALIVAITEQPDDLRAWAEQVAPLAGSPMVVATGFSASPLIEPYVKASFGSTQASIQGLLVGYRDAYTYETMLGFIPAVPGSNITNIPVNATPVPGNTSQLPALEQTATAAMAQLNPSLMQTAT